MIFLVPLIIAATIVIVFFGGRFANLLEIRFKHPWLVLTSLIIKIISISGLYIVVGLPESINPLFRIGSLLLVIIFTLFNLSYLGVPVVGIGLFLNTLVIAVNGGNMPINENYAHLVFTAPELGRLKDGLPVDSFILSSADTKFSFLGDVLSLPWGGHLFKLFSIGDIVITLGGIIFITYHLRQPGYHGYRQ